MTAKSFLLICGTSILPYNTLIFSHWQVVDSLGRMRSECGDHASITSHHIPQPKCQWLDKLGLTGILSGQTACRVSNRTQLLSHHKLYNLNHFKYSPVELGEIEWTEKGDFHFANFRINYHFQDFTFGNYFVVTKREKNPNFNTNINRQLLW